MPDGDHEVLARKDVQLAELHRLGVVEVAGRPEYRKQVVPIALQLGPLVGRNGIFNSKLMKAISGSVGR